MEQDEWNSINAFELAKVDLPVWRVDIAFADN
jgi:hypothetical protein